MKNKHTVSEVKQEPEFPTAGQSHVVDPKDNTAVDILLTSTRRALSSEPAAVIFQTLSSSAFSYGWNVISLAHASGGADMMIRVSLGLYQLQNSRSLLHINLHSPSSPSANLVDLSSAKDPTYCLYLHRGYVGICVFSLRLQPFL